MSEGKKQRYDGLDILKTICACMVIGIHARWPGKLGDYSIALFRVAVPVFFIISGFFFKSLYEKKKISAHLKKLVIFFVVAWAFYACWNSFLWIHIGIFEKRWSEIFSAESILKFLFLNQVNLNIPLWYLPALIYTTVFFVFLEKYDRVNLLNWIVPLALAIYLVLGKYSQVIFGFSVSSKWFINAYFTGIPFFFLGYKLQSNINRIYRFFTSGIKYKVLILLVITFLMQCVEHYLLSVDGKIGIGDIYISTIICSILWFVFFLRYISIKGPITKVLAEFGRKYSIYIYLFHSFFVTVYRQLFDLFRMPSWLDYLTPIICIGISVVGSIFIELCFSKLKLFR